MIDAVIGSGIILVLYAIGGGVAAQMNPADVCPIKIPGADELADDRAVVRIAPKIHPAHVRAISVFVERIDAGGRLEEQRLNAHGQNKTKDES